MLGLLSLGWLFDEDVWSFASVDVVVVCGMADVKRKVKNVDVGAAVCLYACGCGRMWFSGCAVLDSASGCDCEQRAHVRVVRDCVRVRGCGCLMMHMCVLHEIAWVSVNVRMTWRLEIDTDSRC